MKAIVALISGALLFSPSQPLRLSTWTIVAADPKTGDVGVAGASCLPNQYAEAIAALVPGKGAAAVQGFWDLGNRNRVYELLQAGIASDEIIRQVTNPLYDRGFNDRQYGIVTIKDGAVSIQAFTGADAIAWAGAEHDSRSAVTVQGNILVGPEVVRDALTAFKQEGALDDRLMRALETGSAAGGDLRCNSGSIRQTAATAFILVARGGDAPYAAADIGVTDQGTGRAPWLDISVTDRQFGPNPVKELRRRFDRIKKGVYRPY